MKVYVVENVKPNVKVFSSKESALDYAKMKANKRNCPTSVWLESIEGIENEVYCSSEIAGASHIYIYEREVES